MCGPHSTVFCLCSLSTPELFLALRSLSGARKLGGTAVSRRLTQTHPLHPSVRPSASASVLSSRRLLRVFIGKGRRTRSVGSSLRKASEQLSSLSCVGEVREGGNEIVKSRCGGMNERTKESKSETRCRRPNRNNQYQFQPSIDLSGVLISICITLSLLQAFSS